MLLSRIFYIPFFATIIVISFYPVFGSFFLADDAAWLTQVDKGEIFQPIRWGYFRPITLLVVWILYNLFNLSTIYYNVFSLVIHTLNTFILFLLLEEITNNKILSFLSSLFFAVSCSHFQAVMWMADIGDLLSGGFFFLTLYLYILYRKQDKKTFFILSLLFYLLGLFSKEITICAFAIIILWDLLFKKEFKIKLYLSYFLTSIFYIFCYARAVNFSIGFIPSYEIGSHFLKNIFSLFVGLFLSIAGITEYKTFLNYPKIELLLYSLRILFLLTSFFALFYIFKNINKISLKLLLFSILFIVIIFLPLSFFLYLRDLPGAFFARYRFFYLPSAGLSIFIGVFSLLVLSSNKKYLGYLFFSITIILNSISNNILSRDFKERTKIQETIVKEVGKKCINCNKIYLLGFPEGMHIRPYLQDFIDLYYNKCCKIVFVKDTKEIKESNASLLVLQQDGRIVNKLLK